MPLVHADRVKETSTTTGTGTYSLAGAVAGFRTFVAGVGDNNTCYYVAEDGTDWEIGLGTVDDATPDTLARTRILASSNAGAAVNWAAGTRNIFCAPLASQVGPMIAQFGHIFGLETSRPSTSTITVAAGEATDEDGEVLIRLTSPITKSLASTWAVGSGNGGLNTGAEANSTWYEVHLIYRQDTGVVDVMFTTTANRNTLPANYTHHRRIGWIRNDGSGNILNYFQDGDYFSLETPVNDIAASTTTTATAAALTCPPNAVARYRATIVVNTTTVGNSGILFRDPDAGSYAPDDLNGNLSLGNLDAAAAAGAMAGHFETRVNGSSQIEYDSEATTGSPTFDVATFGWIDTRRRLRNI